MELFCCASVFLPPTRHKKELPRDSKGRRHSPCDRKISWPVIPRSLTFLELLSVCEFPAWCSEGPRGGTSGGAGSGGLSPFRSVTRDSLQVLPGIVAGSTHRLGTHRFLCWVFPGGRPRNYRYYRISKSSNWSTRSYYCFAGVGGSISDLATSVSPNFARANRVPLKSVLSAGSSPPSPERCFYHFYHCFTHAQNQRTLAWGVMSFSVTLSPNSADGMQARGIVTIETPPPSLRHFMPPTARSLEDYFLDSELWTLALRDITFPVKMRSEKSPSGNNFRAVNPLSETEAKGVARGGGGGGGGPPS